MKIHKVVIEIDEWLDEHGMLHDIKNPKPHSTINSILFTSQLHLLALDLGVQIPKPDLLASKPFNANSHDNQTGAYAVGRKLGLYHTNNPLKLYARRWWFHPRDVIMYGYSHKYLWPPFWFFLWIPSISCIISCWRDYKTNHTGKHLSSSGKCLSWVRCVGFDMHITLAICNYLIVSDKKWGSWKAVFEEYFRKEGHPLPLLIEAWEFKWTYKKSLILGEVAKICIVLALVLLYVKN